MTDNDIKRIMLELPHGFTLSGKHYNVYQPTLGKTYLNAQLVQALNVFRGGESLDSFVPVDEKQKHNSCLYIAYQTFNTKEELTDFSIIEARAKEFEAQLDNEGVASLLMLVSEYADIKEAIRFLKIDEDNTLMQRVHKAKAGNNTYTFGGKSVYGALIGAACEKYHWTYDYVVWGISYANLQLLMADSISSVYVTDEERKANFLPSPNAKHIKVTADNLAEIKKRFS